MDKLFAQMPKDIGYEWTGLSYQEEQSGAQAPALYGLSILVIFCAWRRSMKAGRFRFSVMLVIPLGVIGAHARRQLRGLYNDIYFQVGLLDHHRPVGQERDPDRGVRGGRGEDGADRAEAALEAARLRLRPILMTSIAFIAGVMPLAIATGAGAGSQNDIGTGVIGGMITATVLAIFFVPVFFEIVNTRLQKHE